MKQKQKVFKKIQCWVIICLDCMNAMTDGGDTIMHFETRKEAKEMLDNGELYCSCG